MFEISFERHGGPAPGVVPVVWADVDLFGYPAAKVEAALPRTGPESGVFLERAGAYVTGVRLSRR